MDNLSYLKWFLEEGIYMRVKVLRQQNIIFINLTIAAVLIILVGKFLIIEPKVRILRGKIRDREIKRVKTIFSREFKSFKNDLSNYSTSYDLSNAILNKDIDFIKNYLGPIYMAKTNTDYIGFFNLEKDELWSVKNSRLYFETGELIKDKIGDGPLIKWNKKDKNYDSVEFIKFKGQNYLYGVHFIMDNINNNNPRGYLIFLRKIDEKYIGHLQENSGYSFTLAKEDEIPISLDKNIFGIKIPSNPTKEIFIPFYNSDNMVIFRIKFILDMPETSESIFHLTEFTLMLLIVLIVFFANIRVRNILKPIIKLHDHLDGINKNIEFKHIIHENNVNEIDSVIHSFNNMLHLLEKRDTELKTKNSILRDMVYIDSLTGVGSRRLLQDKIPKKFEEAFEKKEPVSIAMIDVDNFKAYNDNYGHIKGDTILIKIGCLLRSNFQEADFIIRYGGEEFMIFIKGKSPEEIENIMYNFLEKMRDEKIEHSHGIGGIITLSIGAFSVIPDKADSLEECIKIADNLLYEAKKTGRNKVIFQNDILK
jgi:diguanylate cyclase (GGDEF)-like protein